MKFWKLSLSCLASLVLLTGVVSADEPATEGPATDQAPDYDALVEQLESVKFAERQNAMRQLQAAGQDAFGALEKAAQSDSREVITRCIEILENQFNSGTDEAKAAAKSSLEKIASTGNAAAAQRAKDALTPPMPQNNNVPGFGGGFQIVPGNVQIQIQGQAQINGKGQRITVKNVNGDKEIEVVEGDRTVKINEAKSGEIKLEVTEKKDGKEETKKYEAKNAEELKKNEPDAYKIYDEYNKKGGGNNIQIRAIQLQPGAIPAIPRIQGVPMPLPGIPGRIQRGNIQPGGLELHKLQLERMQESIKRIAEDAGNEELKKVAEQIEDIKKQIEDAQKDLETEDGDAGKTEEADEEAEEEAPAAADEVKVQVLEGGIQIQVGP